MNEISAPDADAWHVARRWVLVAGTGLFIGTPARDIRCASAVGDQLARNRYGLVAGVWHGVDHFVAKAFVARIKADGLDCNDYLIRVIPADRDVDPAVEGRLVRPPHGAREWLEPQKYADAIIVIGGRGGTYSTWLGALHDGTPRFPFGATKGDAGLAFRQTVDLWELIPVPGITLGQFERLGEEIASAADAERVAAYLVGDLLWRSLAAIDASSRGGGAGASLFISYSRKDVDWITRFRTLLRPAERRGLLSTWVDADLEPGKAWADQLREKLERCDAGLILVTRALLQSRYVREVEIPAFIRRREATPGFRIFWALLEPCDWREIAELSAIEAVGGLVPVSESATKSDEQCRLIDIVDAITRAMTRGPKTAHGSAS